MDAKTFTFLITIIVIGFAALIWAYEYWGYKKQKNKSIKVPEKDQQFVICAMERCKHNHNGNCRLKYISHDEYGKCQNYEYKSLNKWA